VTSETRRKAKQHQQELILRQIAVVHRQSAAFHGEQWSS
jgi:hypothetical protein